VNILKYTVLLSSVAFLAACSETSSSKKSNSGESLNPESLSVVSSHLEKVTCTYNSSTKVKSLDSDADQTPVNEVHHSSESIEVEVKVEKLSDGKSERRYAKGTNTTNFFEVEGLTGSEESVAGTPRNFTYEATTFRKTEKLADGTIKTTDSTTTKNSLKPDEERKSNLETIKKKMGNEVVTISEKLNSEDTTKISSNYRYFEIENGKETITTAILVKPDIEVYKNFQYETTMSIQTCIKTIQ